MENTKTITVLNKLVELHNDRINGYEISSKVADDQELKTLFAQLARIRKDCRQELAVEINRLGGVPWEAIIISDRFFNVWMEVNDVLTDTDRENLLDYCEFSEDEAIGKYKAVLDDNAGYLSLEQKSMIHLQLTLLTTGYNAVKALSAAMIENTWKSSEGLNSSIPLNTGQLPGI